MIKNIRSTATRIPLFLALFSLVACGGATAPSPSGGTPTPTPTSGSGTPTPSPSGYDALASLTASTSYSIAGFAGVGYNGDPTTGGVLPNGAISGDNPVVRFRYDSATRSYLLVTYDVVAQKERYLLFSTQVDATDTRYTNDRFRGYVANSANASSATIFRLYRSEASNPELRLAYSSFGNLASSGPLGHLNFSDFWLAYGVATRSNDTPPSVVANYSGVIYGVAIDTAAGKRYQVEGTAAFIANFGARSVTGTFNLTLVGDDGVRIAIGAAPLTGGQISSLEGVHIPFALNMAGAAIASGEVTGNFFGPQAREIAGILRGGVNIPNSTGNVYFQGAFAAISN